MYPLRPAQAQSLVDNGGFPVMQELLEGSKLDFLCSTCHNFARTEGFSSEIGMPKDGKVSILA